MSGGLDTVLTRFTLVSRVSTGNGLKATFARAAPARKMLIAYAAGSRQASLSVADRSMQLRVEAGEPADPASWRCDCPLGVNCLHAALAARGLTDEVAAGSAALADEPPDARFVFSTVEAVPSGLAAAASRSSASIERADDDAVRCDGATVRRTDTRLSCDCPMGAHSTCLHRLVVEAWARGERAATRGTAVQARAGASTSRPIAEAVVKARPGERLAPEELARFGPLLGRTSKLIAELLTFGLQRTTSMTLERLDALVIAVKTLGVRDAAPRDAGLGRLLRTLERLRQVLEDFQRRLVTTTELDVMRELAIARNLIRALEANTGALPLMDFAGATQQEYEPTAVLDIQGLGLESWTTTAGFGGVTSYVADLRTGRILTRTNALPSEQLDAMGGNWRDQLAASPAFAGASVTYTELARGRFLLSGALVAADAGRLSGSGKTQLAKRPALAMADEKLRSATLLAGGDAIRLARRLSFDALGRPPPSPPLVLVPVAKVGPTHFDRLTQQLSVSLLTPAGVELPCVLTYRDSISLWVDNLDRLSRTMTAPVAVLCRLRLELGGLFIEPLTAHFADGKPQHLTFTRLEVPMRALVATEETPGAAS